jgi:hypothetical protein
MNDAQAWAHTRESFAADLLPNEKLLWAGQPDVGVTFHPSDAYRIPFSLLLLGFALFWEWGVLHTSGGPSGDWFFKLWGHPLHGHRPPLGHRTVRGEPLDQAQNVLRPD